MQEAALIIIRYYNEYPRPAQGVYPTTVFQLNKIP